MILEVIYKNLKTNRTVPCWDTRTAGALHVKAYIHWWESNSFLLSNVKDVTHTPEPQSMVTDSSLHGITSGSDKGSQLLWVKGL